MDKQKFSKLVKEIRKHLALSQEDLARELGVSFATINRWENERAKPSILAKAQFDRFFARMIQRGKLKGFEGGAK